MKDHSGGDENSAKSRQGPRLGRVLWWLGALGLLVLAAGFGLARLPGRAANPPAATLPAAPTDPAPLDAAPSLGPANAPVTLIEYGDFGCPACWYWYKQGVLEQLRAKYGDRLRFIWRDFPVITLLSPRAAEAGQCAHEQGKFWEFRAAVYEHDGKIEAGDLQAYAAAAGLDLAKFNACLSTHRYRERVNAEQSEAFGHGFVGTPAFLINNQPLVGPQSLELLSSMIDPLLAPKK